MHECMVMVGSAVLGVALQEPLSIHTESVSAWVPKLLGNDQVIWELQYFHYPIVSLLMRRNQINYLFHRSGGSIIFLASQKKN